MENGNGNGMRRVVITGMGLVSPLGNDVDTSWSRLLAGESGAAAITAFDHTDYNVHFACELKDFDPTVWVDRKASRRMDRFAQMILAAARQAEWSAYSWRMAHDTSRVEAQLRESADPRLALFASAVMDLWHGKSRDAWAIRLTTTRDMGGGRHTKIEGNREAVVATRELLREAAAEALAMQLEALPYAQVTERLSALSAKLSASLRSLDLKAPEIASDGAVVNPYEHIAA